MRQYNVGLAQIHAATGYTRDEMADYIAKSDNAQLKADLAKCNDSTPMSTGGEVSDTAINPNTSPPSPTSSLKNISINIR